MKKIIIFGGTFDPVHNAHMRIAIAASLKLNADVIFVPSKSPRWKNPLTSSEHRTKMLKLALKDAPSGSMISDFELKSGDEINYSIDTVKYFINKYPKAKLYFLIGADQVNKFNEWKDAEELSKLATITFVSRPNYPLDKSVVDKYHMLDLGFLDSGDTSSTDVRELKSIDIPDNVREYIEKNRLYYVGKLEKYLPEQRLLHSLRVADLSLKIAKINKLEHPERFYFAGLLHDLGKTYKTDSSDSISFMKEHFPEYMDLPKFSYHQFIGAYLAEHDFGVKDEIILDAIKYHCTGKANMSDVGMVVYAADKIEPSRPFDSKWLINSCFKNWKQGFLDTLEDNKKYLLNHNKDITNRFTDECFEMYLGEK